MTETIDTMSDEPTMRIQVDDAERKAEEAKRASNLNGSDDFLKD